jgi:DNA-binding HxlR family transcriptional regulator
MKLRENLIRNQIIEILRVPKGVQEIKDELRGVSSLGTLSYHLRILLEEGVIKKKKFEELQGRPTKYFLKGMGNRINNALKPGDIDKLFKDKIELIRIKILSLIKEKTLSPEEIFKKFPKEDQDYINDILFNESEKNYLNLKAEITQKGKNYLRENTKSQSIKKSVL